MNWTLQHLKRERKITWRTHCYRGHEWTEANTLEIKDPRAKHGKRRQCRTCKEIAMDAWVAKNRPKKVVPKPAVGYTPAEPNYS